MAATRRKGKWAGGTPLLGYDLDPRGTRLVVNEDEAVRVRAIFELYLQHEALLPVVKELAARGWTTKRWRTRAGRERGGEGFTKTNLHRLLTNPTFVGKVRHRGEVYPGEQPAIVKPEIYEQAQSLLQRNARTGGAPGRNQFGAVLKGILHCGPCGCAMTPSHTKKDSRLYRYYVCTAAQKKGWDACPSKSIPAAEIERVVVDRIRAVGRDPAVLVATVAEARRQDRSAHQYALKALLAGGS
jgi:site-specific DNA recombinase